MKNPTPLAEHTDVDSILRSLRADIREILKDHLIGMYLYGSLAYGGFDQDSDIDFLAVTRNDISDGEFSALQSMHARIGAAESVWAMQLEGSYIPLHALQDYDPARALYFHIDRGPGECLHRMQIDDPALSRGWWGGWVLLRAVLREHGIALAGPEPGALIGTVAPGELKLAAQAILDGWAEPLLDHPERIDLNGYQAYTVLTLCRILYTLETGAIASKPDAARWAMERLDNPWKALIERAGNGRHHPQGKAAADEIQSTLEFARFVLARR